MEETIRNRYSRGILDQALHAFGVKHDQLQELDGFESFIYQFNRGQEQGILRITHSIRRTPGQIRGELDWINYLKEGGAGVAQALAYGPWLVEPISSVMDLKMLAGIRRRAEERPATPAPSPGSRPQENCMNS